MGARKLLEERITALMQTLPDKALEGLLVHMENISLRTKEEYQKNLDEIVGKYRDYLTPSDEFSRRKQEEKKLDR